VSEGLVVNARAMPPMTWNGTLVGADETVTHYLHLSVFPCEQCNGNILRLLTESNDEDPAEDLAEAGLSGGGNMCQCRVGVRRKGDRTFD